MMPTRVTLKYVIVRRYGREWPIVFPEAFEHRSVVGPDSRVVSAGFLRAGVAFGRSDSLDVESRPGVDTPLLLAWLTAAAAVVVVA